MVWASVAPPARSTESLGDYAVPDASNGRGRGTPCIVIVGVAQDDENEGWESRVDFVVFFLSLDFWCALSSGIRTMRGRDGFKGARALSSRRRSGELTVRRIRRRLDFVTEERGARRGLVPGKKLFSMRSRLWRGHEVIAAWREAEFREFFDLGSVLLLRKHPGVR